MYMQIVVSCFKNIFFLFFLRQYVVFPKVCTISDFLSKPYRSMGYFSEVQIFANFAI